MKKIFSMLALVSLLAVACKDKKEDKKEEPTTQPTTTEPTTTPTTTEPAPTTNADGVPTFSDPEVQKYATDVTAFVNSYIDAAKSKDFTKMTDLSTKWQDWSTRAAAIGPKLAAKPEEAKAWADYWTKLSAQWVEAAKSLIPTTK